MTDEQAAPPSGVEVTLSRELGLSEVLMIGIGPNIGSSIFLLIGFAAGISGPALLAVFILNFIVTIFTAMAYAELASAYPETGGGYRWIKEGLSGPLGFLGGWMSWIGHCIACSVYAIGFGLGIQELLYQYNIQIFNLSPSIIENLSTVIIAVIFCYLNYRGVKDTGRSQITVSLFLIGTIILFALFCIAALFANPNLPGANGFGPVFLPFGYISIAVGMGFTFMIFEGYEVVAQTGEEAKEPEKTVPRAMFLCITISAILFIAVAACSFAILGWQGVAAGKDSALTLAAQRVVPILGGALMSIGVIVGSVASVNSIVFSASRVSFAMGRDGNLPAVFGRLDKKNHTPAAAIMISGVIIIFMAIALPINSVASVADVLILLLFVMVNVAAITLRKKHPEVKRYFVTPFYPWIPIIGVVSKFFLAIMLFDYEPLCWYLAILVIVSGLLMYYFAKGRKTGERFEASGPAPLSAEAKARFRVLIPVDNPKNEALIDLGVTLAAKNDGEILLVNVFEVPYTVPFNLVDRTRVEEREKMIAGLKGYSERKGVKTRATVLVSHDVVASIIGTAKDQGVNTIIVGWKGYTNTEMRALGHKLDEIVRKTPCDIMVLKTQGELKPAKIMVLSGNLWHVSKAAEVAADIAKRNDSRVTILDVNVNMHMFVRAMGYQPKETEYSKKLKKLVESKGVQVSIKDIQPDSIINGVVDESASTDLLVIGCTTAVRWDPFIFGHLQDVIVKNAMCPVLVYKRVGPNTQDSPMIDIENLVSGQAQPIEVEGAKQRS